ncbi:hypothetical protein [Prauserella marina]|nr:hypothetical protein [Prauserella marina]
MTAETYRHVDLPQLVIEPVKPPQGFNIGPHGRRPCLDLVCHVDL